MEIVKYMGICLSNNWETIDLGAVFMRFYLINVLIQNLAVSNFHAIRHWTEFLDNNAWNPFFWPTEVSDDHRSRRNQGARLHMFVMM